VIGPSAYVISKVLIIVSAQGTGDFDGDIYSVLFCSNEFVSAVKHSSPVNYTAMTVTTNSTTTVDNEADHLPNTLSGLAIEAPPVGGGKKVSTGAMRAMKRSNAPDANNELYHLRRFEGNLTHNIIFFEFSSDCSLLMSILRQA
jgi:hypothetical protein